MVVNSKVTVWFAAIKDNRKLQWLEQNMSIVVVWKWNTPAHNEHRWCTEGWMERWQCGDKDSDFSQGGGDCGRQRQSGGKIFWWMETMGSLAVNWTRELVTTMVTTRIEQQWGGVMWLVCDVDRLKFWCDGWQRLTASRVRVQFVVVRWAVGCN